MPAPTARTTLERVLQHSRAQGLVLSAALVCCACGGNEQPVPERPLPTYGMTRQLPTNTSNTSTAQPSQRPEANRLNQNSAYPGDTRPRFEEPPLKAAEKAAPPEEKKERDYSSELSNLLSQSVSGCLTASPPSTSSVSIRVTAHVMATGTVSRAEAQGAGLATPALTCIKNAAGALRLKAPVADAPRTVQAQLTFQTQGAPKALQPKAAVEDSREDERDGNPRDSKVHDVDDHPVEVEQKLYEDAREAAEVPDPKDEPPTDNHAE
jgi:hypothetical protein